MSKARTSSAVIISQVDEDIQWDLMHQSSDTTYKYSTSCQFLPNILGSKNTHHLLLCIKFVLHYFVYVVILLITKHEIISVMQMNHSTQEI